MKDIRDSRSGADSTPEVTVHPGDSLWTIAARHLGPNASDANVAKAWPHWYAANRALIGEFPDLLQPGQILHPPASSAGSK